MDGNKLLLQDGGMVLESESDDEDFNPLDKEENEEEEERENNNDNADVNGDRRNLHDGENGGCNKIRKHKHILFFYPDEMESNFFIDGKHQRCIRKDGNILKGDRVGMQHSFRGGVAEMSEREDKENAERSSFTVKGRRADLQNEFSTLSDGVVETSTAAAGKNSDEKKTKKEEVEDDVLKEQHDTESDYDNGNSSNSSMILDPLEAAREIDELSDGFSENDDDPARNNRKRRRLRRKMSSNESELKNFTILGVSV